MPNKGKAVIKIHDISGKIIRSYAYDMISSGRYEIKLNKNELPVGNCFATLSCEDKKETIKLSETEY